MSNVFFNGNADLISFENLLSRTTDYYEILRWWPNWTSHCVLNFVWSRAG